MIDKKTTAAFDVDPQKGFTPICPNELPVPEGDMIANELNAQAEFAAMRLVSKDCHPAVAPWITTDANEMTQPVEGDYPNLDVKWLAHCVIGTEGNKLIPGLPEEAAYDIVICKGMDPEKHPYGACYHDLADTQSTGAIEALKANGIQTVIVGGLATDFCVKTTALQLLDAGFDVILNLAACRGIFPELIDAAIKELTEKGATIINNAEELTGAA